MIVVMLPYILENPVNISRYTENTNETRICHPKAVKTAPGSCLLSVVLASYALLFGRNLYTRSQNTVSITKRHQRPDPHDKIDHLDSKRDMLINHRADAVAKYGDDQGTNTIATLKRAQYIPSP